MHHDLHGQQKNSGIMLIELRDFGVRFEGRDLQPTNGPHEVPRWFGFELVSGGRAREVERPEPKAPPAREIVHNDPAPTHNDPAPPANGDPKPRGRGLRR